MGGIQGGEVSADPHPAPPPRECCVMAWATLDFYECSSGREEPSTGGDDLDDWQDDWCAATVCILSLRLFIPSPDAPRPLCLSPSPPIIRISVMTASQQGLWAAPVCLTRVPLTLLCFPSFKRVNWTAAEHFYLWQSSVWSSSTSSTLSPTSAWSHMLWWFFCLYCLLQSTDRYYFKGNMHRSTKLLVNRESGTSKDRQFLLKK